MMRCFISKFKFGFFFFFFFFFYFVPVSFRSYACIRIEGSTSLFILPIKDMAGRKG